MNSTVICLMGPTASGKTDLAVALAQHVPVELVSVDSAQIYRDMNIGTAKPGAEVLAEFPHRLVDIVDPWEPYSVFRFLQDVTQAMSEIQKNGKIPLLVGGTMMYFNALQQGLALLPDASPSLREAFNQRIEQEGLRCLYQELQHCDPDTAAKIHPNDQQRIIRALEVWQITGVPLSQLQRQDVPHQQSDDYINLALMPTDRGALHQRIADRFETMLTEGLIDEVEALRQLPKMHADLPSMKCVGYRQVWRYLDGALNYTDMRDKGIVATRQLAKRQLTWLRRWDNLHVVDNTEHAMLSLKNSGVALW
jgi:tRNA dimethylallyltransferase